MRTDPPDSASERDLLCTFLDFPRETVLLEAEGLTAEPLARTIASSSLTLAGLLDHLALVEGSWFRGRFAGLPADESWAGVDWDAEHEFRTALGLEPDELRARYVEACARSRAVLAGAASLDDLPAGTSPRGEPLGAAARDGGNRPARPPRRPAARGHRRDHRGVTQGAAGRTAAPRSNSLSG